MPARPIRSRAPVNDVTGHCDGDLDPLAKVGFARLPQPLVLLLALLCRALSGEVTVHRTPGDWGGPSARVALSRKSPGALEGGASP